MVVRFLAGMMAGVVPMIELAMVEAIMEAIM
jgi:hypothetical protein